MDDDQRPGPADPDHADPDHAEPDQAGPDQAGPDQAEPTAPDPSRARLLVLVASLAVAALVVAFLAFRPDDEPARAAPAPTTTARKTTTAVLVPATKAVVAAAKGPSILVRSTPPPEWETATPVKTWDNPAPVASQASTPLRPALPRFDLPIQGRYADAAGWTFSNPTSFGADDPFVMLVTERRGDWLKVQVPVRPNGSDGWVPASDVTLSETPYRIELRLGERKLRVFNGNDQVLETGVVVGKDDTHTPTGRFYVTDKVEQSNPAGAYGPLALPISAYSEQIDEFDNGVPVIAMHGTNRPELIGQNVSNGCIRMPNDVITRIGETVPLGTPVDISP
jgi:lipoprotein-anchoring transpeptidase ErfK/SrfK